jgi:Family of unknown function (DUF6174)
VRPAPLALALALALLTVVAAAAPALGEAPQPPRDDPDPAITDGRAQHALDAARRRWRRARIHNYRFTLDRICFCPVGEPVVMFVRDDRPVSPPSEFRRLATVRRLQRAVQHAIDARVHALSVHYDARGIPRRLAIDGHGAVADDEVTYSVDRFWRGTKGRGGPDTPTSPTVR